MAEIPELTIARLRECLFYEPDTGIIRWRIKPTPRMHAGDIAGCYDHRGYLLIRVDDRLLLGHRIAWALHYGQWPRGDLDHSSANKRDNRIENLRLASRAQNIANTYAQNKNGLPKGVYQLKGRKNFYSQIKVNGKLKKLGYFATLEAAAAAFARAHQEAHGEFSRCEVGNGRNS